MDVDSIRAFCLAFPNATEKLQWGDELCFKVGDKIFVMLGLDTLRICFKCTPTTFAELIEREDMRPAPYVGRYKWVMLDRLDAAGDEELQALIRQSFEMVSSKVPKKKAIRRVRKKRVSSRAKGAVASSRKKKRR
jgi:predicted DNA-binding protein (MmcQ/YjbR family)